MQVVVWEVHCVDVSQFHCLNPTFISSSPYISRHRDINLASLDQAIGIGLGFGPPTQLLTPISVRVHCPVPLSQLSQKHGINRSLGGSTSSRNRTERPSASLAVSRRVLPPVPERTAVLPETCYVEICLPERMPHVAVVPCGCLGAQCDMTFGK